MFQSIDILRNLYGSVDEVDLFAAGVSEKPVPGALLGPTFLCLVGDQFGRLRRGDRFFYEEGNQPSSFKPGTGMKKLQGKISLWDFDAKMLFFCFRPTPADPQD